MFTWYDASFAAAKSICVLESHPDLSDNTYALYEELLRRGYHKKYKLYWMKTFPGKPDWNLPEGVSYFENQPSGFCETIRRAYVLNTSRYIMDCNSFVKKRRKGPVSYTHLTLPTNSLV